ncbi:MAG TPA: hypothetical protein VNO24_01235 [Blastocatellia bacterium]|nr:hypothetical protein [Blastocatellia bacterium]
MKRKRRTTTTIEQREVVVIRRSRKVKKFLCHECSEPVALITLDEAVKISGLNSRAVYRLIEEDQIHFTETQDGLGLICPATLLARASRETDG